MRPRLHRSGLARAVPLLGLLLAVIAVHAQSADVAAIKTLNETWIRGYQGKDTGALSHIWADDFVLINPQPFIFYRPA